MGQRSATYDYVENLPLRLLTHTTRPMSWAGRHRVGVWCARRLLRNVRGLRRRIVNNLTLIYPDMTPDAQAILIDKMADNLGRTLLEILHADQFRLEAHKFQLRDDRGLQVLKDTLRAGKPAITVTGHFGNWEAGRSFMQSHGMEPAGLFRPLHNRYTNADMLPRYAAFGAPLFPKGREGIRGLIRHLSSGGMLGALHDQKMNDGEMLDFMGQPAATSLVIVELAIKFKAPIVPAYATRNPDGHTFTVDCEPPIPHSNAVEMTQALNNSLAERVRQIPEQWYWLHQRWKPPVRAPRQSDPIASAPQQ